MIFPTLFKDDCEAWATLTVVVCAGLLSAALVMEYAFGFAPCPLCLMQRIWFAIAGLCAIAGLMHSPRWGIYPLLTILASLIGAGFAIRQLYLQSLPPEEVPACGPDMTYLLENIPLAEVLAIMTRGTGDCAEVAWRFLGLTLPGWALVGFVVIVLMAVAQMRAGSR